MTRGASSNGGGAIVSVSIPGALRTSVGFSPFSLMTGVTVARSGALLW